MTGASVRCGYRMANWSAEGPPAEKATTEACSISRWSRNGHEVGNRAVLPDSGAAPPAGSAIR
jgi:hypothetical protein